MEINPSFGALLLAMFMYGVFAASVYLLTRHPERQKTFTLSEFILDVDRAIAIGALLVGTTSLVLWINPDFIDRQHATVPFIFWIGGGAGVCAFIVGRLRRAFTSRRQSVS